MKELEEFRTRDIGRGGGSSSSRSSSNRGSSNRGSRAIRSSPKHKSSGRMSYRTLGGTGGGPFWGWGFYPWTTLMYPILDYAEYPESIDVIPVVESKKIMEKYINVKTIMPTYK